MKYNHIEIEKKWQKFWKENKTFRTPEFDKLDKDKPKFYVLDMFPYPSGDGLHVGHPEGYTATDIVARYKRMQGYNVLHPMGWDAFGLPTEQFALKTGIHPKIRTAECIIRFRNQLDSIGLSYDWDREINTSDEKFFRWTQWIFLKLYNSYYDDAEDKAKPLSELKIPDGLNEDGKREFLDAHRLAYLSDGPVNWSPELGTVLANDEVAEQIEKGHTVVRRNMRQWKLRITKYADRLLKSLDELDWPANLKEIQRNWIGRSEGAMIKFKIESDNLDDGRFIEVFTTRPDTIFGATYMVLAPEHPLVSEITTSDNLKTVDEYVLTAAKKSDLERQELSKDKTGAFTGAYAINPANGKKIPVLISDYVLVSYGTGAIMSVPGHDERDMEFAKKFNLEIIPVVIPDEYKNTAFKKIKSDDGSEIIMSGPGIGMIEGRSDNEFHKFLEDTRKGDVCFTGEGYAFNSGFLNGLTTEEAKKKIINWIEENKLGKRSVNYKLRDWLFSRQRYWGEPFPIIHLNDRDSKALKEGELPLTLPDVQSYKPSGTGESPLANITDWVNTTDKETGKQAKRETNTMPQLAGSSWYFLRFIDPVNSDIFVDKEKEKYWMPVDLYIGGSEHAVGHLLYARLWQKFLYDLGYVSHDEPFRKLFNQGMVLGEDGQKMSKSRGNVVNPDDVIEQFGADSLRLFEMFMGPLEAAKPWSTTGIEGMNRFLKRIWRLIIDEETGNLKPNITDEEPELRLNKLLHFTIKKITHDINDMDMKFNTSIAQMMIFTNELYKAEKISREILNTFVLLLSPTAPHIAEELWSALGNKDSLSYQQWPKFDEELAKADMVTVVFSVNGKVRGKKEMQPDLSDKTLEQEALDDPNVIKHILGKEVVKIIVVKNKMVNIVVK